MYVTAAQTQDINNVADVLSAADGSGSVQQPRRGGARDHRRGGPGAGRRQGRQSVVAGDDHRVQDHRGTNNGPSDAENVMVYDRLPPGIVVTVVTVRHRAAAAAPPARPAAPSTSWSATWARWRGRPGSKTIIIEADVDPGLPAGTVLENDAFVIADIFDDDNSNNQRLRPDRGPVGRRAGRDQALGSRRRGGSQRRRRGPGAWPARAWST